MGLRRPVSAGMLPVETPATGVSTMSGERRTNSGTGPDTDHPVFRHRNTARGFSLLDVLVTMAVISVLMALLVPSLAKVNETARRVVCQSNVRQIGLGVLMYADDWQGQLPPSIYLASGAARGAHRPQEMVTLRVPEADDPSAPWDGLGILFTAGYLPAPKVFYCPSHTGENPYSRYAMLWSPEGPMNGEIVCNYHYRGEGPMRPRAPGEDAAPTTRALFMIDPAQSSLVADGMRVRSDYNHKVGVNFFRADLTVHWYDDSARELAGMLPVSKDDATPVAVNSAWERFDRSANDGGVD